ncbi:MAG: hypothetical protein JWQ14_1464, partial [Adhaeribacter sp.]|nr:hypothetical protein [Adhaeribacter sp.]
ASEPFSAIDLRVTRIFASAFFDEVRKFPTVCQHNLVVFSFLFVLEPFSLLTICINLIKVTGSAPWTDVYEDIRNNFLANVS